MSYIGNEGEASTSSEITALVNLTALAISSAGQFLRKTGLLTFENATPSEVGFGTVTSVSVITANGISGTVATSTTTPAITLTLGAITPSTVQISSLTVSEIVGTNTNKDLISLAVATYPSLAELAYVKGVTSALQTQLGLKAPLASPTFTGTVTIPTPFTIGAVSMIATGTELNFVDGVTSAIQTQLDGKQATGSYGLTTNPLSQFAATTSLQLLGVISDETGTGALVFANTPTLVSPILGVASATSLATSAATPFLLTNGQLVNIALTSQTVGATTLTIPNFASVVDTFVFITLAQTLANKTLTTPVINGLPTGTGVATANTVSTLVARDASGNFAAGTITASLTGNASGSAATVTGAAQTAITSVGILTGLTVSGTLSLTNSSPFSMTNAQAVTVALTAQTVGIATLTIPDFANVSDTFVFKTKAETLSNKTFVAPALGTPASGVLTSCTGLPAASVVAGSFGAGAFVISTSLQAATIELGAATDTTLARVGAGVISVEGVTIDTISATNTLTNKRITLREQTEASNATPTPTSDSTDIHTITALAAAAAFAAPTGTPTQGQKLIIRIKDNATARALTWNAIYRAMGNALPTTTVLSKTTYCGFIYNSTDTKWDLVAVAQEA